MPFRGSHLREVSNNASPAGSLEGALRDAVHDGIALPSDATILRGAQTCTVGVHDDAFSKLDVLVNPAAFPSKVIQLGTRLRIVAQDLESPRQSFKRRNSEHGHNHGHHRRNSTRQHEVRGAEVSFVFVVQDLPPELLARHPNLEISITQRIATALGFKNRGRVTVTPVDEDAYAASHVEIAFRDAYLTRADMWRMVVSELAGKSMYKGQRITFMNTIKAQIKTIYHQGMKRQSAFFGTATKPVFRSESARYVLFIQMSREMWGFDTDGTGDIMFHKVVNGFLPELFHRWDEIGAHHLVSIILFTRMEYDRPLSTSLESPKDGLGAYYAAQELGQTHHKDFYRVLVSDMASGQWAATIEQLKYDFKTFLRDVSLSSGDPYRIAPLGVENPFDSLKEPKEVISGRPTAASKGNILEAINVASSQFSGDYIDRDLVRTGLSIIVVTPGTGVFEVDYDLLSHTTDVLIENGVGIDLVCLSRMPLHSVPLFKYKKAATKHLGDAQGVSTEHLAKPGLQSASLGSVISYPSSNASSPKIKSGILGNHDAHQVRDSDQWHYAIPHWLDVSFWTPHNTMPTAGGSITNPFHGHGEKQFIPRVKMYEVQMMGIMENELSNIAIPYLKPPKTDTDTVDAATSRLRSSSSMASLHPTFRSQPSLDPIRAASASAAPSRGSSPIHHNLKAYGAIFEWMDEYDEAVYKSRGSKAKGPRHVSINARPKTLKNQSSRNSTLRQQYQGLRVDDDEKARAAIHEREANHRTGFIKPKVSISHLETAGKPRVKLSRQISLGFRGVGGLMPKAVPVTEVSSTTALSEASNLRSARPGSAQSRLPTPLTPSVASGDLQLRQLRGRESEVDSSDAESNSTAVEGSQPIAIKMPPKDLKDLAETAGAHLDDHERISMLQDKLPIARDDHPPEPPQVGLSPRKAMAPWLTILNPCNPSATKADPRRRLGRWHHIFPRPLHASHMKWKSLCSPASVPLTTEDFPTPEQLTTEYDEREYTVQFAKEGNMLEDGSEGRWLPRELIGARFSHGFQVVLSDTAARYFQLPHVDCITIFDDTKIGNAGSQIVMSRGSSIHKITTVEDGLVEVKILTRRSAEKSQQHLDGTFMYRPAVRTTLSDSYHPRELAIVSTREAYDWQRLDNFIGGNETHRVNAYPSLLNFWRARYVLIPVERPSSQKRRALPNNEDNEEEIRLEGIRKLTQLWQKYRYIPPEERRLDIAKRRHDNNALDIIYRTVKPSAIVAAEMNVLDGESSDEKAGTLPESDLFDKSSLNLMTLAQTIQGERGINITNRRWHWRLHYNCFIGMELTTWLLNNFRNVDSREEAAELGNELMKQGLFVHVEKRHNFRDGNFFYQIANDYVARKDVRSSWFGRSVPATPLTEHMRLPTGGKSRSGPIEEEEVEIEPMPTSKQKLGAELSHSLIYDVDHRHRSYRPELIVLHYDRISSADDCYHLRIDWMNVTPKLIEDAIANWATLAERNGLRLVELPIAEACKINEFHPFRGPYIIELAKAPPEKQPQTLYDATSLIPKLSPRHVYQEEILRKFNFVLDLEAASDYPRSVDVSYSWGKPDYRYPQYISRTGVILAQITDEGHFLLLANRLYNNRAAGMPEVQRSQRATHTEAAEPAHHSPARQSASRHLASPRASPFPSPRMRAVADVGPGTARLDAITPEKIKDELEAFCRDPVQLEAFYEALLKPSATPGGLMTPTMDSILTTLAAPPALSLRDDTSTPPAVDT